MNILMLTARLPYPANNGAKIRAFQIIKSLAQNHHVTLISYYGSENETRYFDEFDNIGVNLVPIHNPTIDSKVGLRELLTSMTTGLPLTVGKYNDPRMAAAIADNIAGKDVIHCEHMHVAHYAFPYTNITRVVDEHNVESQIAQRLVQHESNPLKKLVLSLNHYAMRRHESRICRTFDMALSVSPQDKELLETGFGAKCVRLIENGVDTGFFHPNASVSKHKSRKLVFVGAMDWLPNSDGIINFVETTLPLIKERYPDIRLDIVGKDPPESVRRLEKVAGIRVTGTVADVRPYAWDSDVFIVPLRFGGGSRLKILEGFSMGIPVVSTTVGCEGIGCKHGREILIADTPDDFADSIVKLFASNSACDQLTGNAQYLVKEFYDWQIICNKLLNYYNRIH